MDTDFFCRNRTDENANLNREKCEPREHYFFNRKNFAPPEMGFVTVYCPFTIVGKIEFDVQLVGGRFVVVSSVNPVKFVGQLSNI